MGRHGAETDGVGSDAVGSDGAATYVDSDELSPAVEGYLADVREAAIDVDVPAPEVVGLEARTSVELDAIAALRQTLGDALVAVRTELSEFHTRSAAHEDLISKMHVRIESLQGGETKKLLRPVSTELISLYSDLGRLATSIAPETTVEQFKGLLENFCLSVEHILDNLGLSPLTTAVGDAFDPRVHNASKRIATVDPALDKTVAAVLRQGFADPLEARPAVLTRVSVYRYEPGNEPGPEHQIEANSGTRLEPDIYSYSDATESRK